MDQSTDDVQRDRERTRSALTNKIELLEECVRDTVMDAKTAVKQTFDVRYHVNRRPWQMLGLSVLAGFLVGRWIADRNRDGPGREFASPSLWRERQETGFDESYPSSAEKPMVSQSRGESTSSRIFDKFHDELAALKGAAVGAVVSVVRDLIRSVTSSFDEPKASKSSAGTSGQSRLH